MSCVPNFNVGVCLLVLLCLVVKRSMEKSKSVCGFVMLLVMFCVLGIVYSVVVFVLVVFAAFYQS